MLRDVLRELDIDERLPGALQRPSSHDRPNLRYEKVRSSDTEWMADTRLLWQQAKAGQWRSSHPA